MDLQEALRITKDLSSNGRRAIKKRKVWEWRHSVNWRNRSKQDLSSKSILGTFGKDSTIVDLKGFRSMAQRYDDKAKSAGQRDSRYRMHRRRLLRVVQVWADRPPQTLERVGLLPNKQVHVSRQTDSGFLHEENRTERVQEAGRLGLIRYSACLTRRWARQHSTRMFWVFLWVI